MSVWSILWICLSSAVQFVLSAEDIQLSNNTCGQSFNVIKGRKYQVKWDGRRLPSGCSLKFINSYSDKYKLVVEGDEYEVRDCDFKLSYKYNGRIRRNYDCRSNIYKNEFYNLDRFYMYFTTGRKASSSKIEIEVTVALDEEEKLSAAEALLGIPAIGILCLCFYAKKKGVNVPECICNCICRGIPQLIGDCLESLCSCECNKNSPNRQESVITHQPTPEPEPEQETETEHTELPTRTPSITISLSDLNEDDYPPAEPTAASRELLAITLPPDYEIPPPSYEDCVDVEEAPPPYHA